MWLGYLSMENKIFLLQNNLWNCTGILSFCFSLLAYTREHNPCGCDTRENFARNLIAIFLLKTSKGFFFYFLEWISIHMKVVWNLDRRIRPPRKISWETGDVPEWGSKAEIKFHDGSHFGTLIWGLNKVMQARNYLQKFGFIKRVDKGWIITVKDLESWRFER